MWTLTKDLPRSPGHPFYHALNNDLCRAGFDEFAEGLCEPYYAECAGRPSIPPGIYFRMLMVGYFEGIDSQRGIAWRCEDSLSIRGFLGLAPTDASPDHSSLTVIRRRLPVEVYDRVFQFVLSMAAKKKLLSAKTLGIDSTTLEANAAMKSIVRKDTGEGWAQYVKGLMEEEGIEEPTEEEMRNFDRKRPDKKVSNDQWHSPTDPDSRITRMKDGRTHLAYKAVHAMDLDSEIIVAATMRKADEGDADSLVEEVVEAQANLILAGIEAEVEEVVGDKGYHKSETLAECRWWSLRTYIAEQESRGKRHWTDKPTGWQESVYGNRRRIQGSRGKRLQRLRSERLERSFAHVCDAGGARRTWLRGIVEVRKRYLIQAATHNLSVIMRKVFGIGKPKALQGVGRALAGAFDRVIGDVLVSIRCVMHARFAKELSAHRNSLKQFESYKLPALSRAA